MSDLTGDYQAAVQAAAAAAGWPQDRLTKLRQQQILRSLAAKSAFTKAALDVAHNVAALRAFLREGQRAYATPGRMGEPERDAFEGEVGAAVRSCSANVDKLQAMLAAGGGGGGSPGRAPSADVLAHRQGQVLILSERLRAATALFDRLRSLRYQQLQQAEAARARRRPQGAPATAAAAAAAAAAAPLTSAQLHQRQQGGYDPAADGQRQQAWQPGGPPGGGGGGQGQQQTQVDTENQALQQELLGMSDQVQQAERTVREIATLNQMFSTAIMAQSEQIEKLYGQAVEATGHISRANVQLGKAIRANRSSRKFLLVFFLAASLGVLFLDWWYS